MKTISKFNNKVKKTAILIDPDKTSISIAKQISLKAEKCGYSFIFIGGSLISEPIDNYILSLKKVTKLPIVLFPGSPLQISKYADSMLLLSLISGRNPEYIIGNHVISAPLIKKYKLETIPTGYILINSGKKSAVEYISNTTAIPENKPDLIVATAIAGEMLGLKTIYLENGSGANKPVEINIIKSVYKNISIPIIVGGGISNIEQVRKSFSAGASIVVIGTAIENDIKNIEKLSIHC